ncbi:glycoside hydrolase family 43 protein [Neptunicella sp. SCSIO 80796]|uniref:glycoside hydrolase family 43 protein n=1 Tax=Neptunicella plasticusilytica TaxID=3117012 RepID=UPI003A4E2D02
MRNNKYVSRLAWLLVGLSLAGCQPAAEQPATTIQASKSEQSARFNWFEYEGNDKVFAKPLADNEFQNPIAAGFYPDPSITRKGDDYYMVVSSFAYTPGLPILHSRDLVTWKLIGHALTRSEQLNMENLGVSRGLFAPTIRYHDGLFYIINTAVDSGGNFFITAEDPAGEWSDPVWLPEIGGIDPDIFFDDDGKVYITHNDAPMGEPLYQGHRAIWMWEYDLQNKQVVKDSGHVIVNGGTDLAKQPIWIEAPHLYKINGWYYLLCAEGGTGYEHSEVVFRTRSLDEPFVPYENNPILTQRDLDIDRPDPITTAGHADIIQTPQGDWWAVFLATRSYDKTFYNTGRESFLLPVSWQDDWPHILETGKTIPYRLKKPAASAALTNTDELTGNFVWHDEFEEAELSPHWSLLRSFKHSWYQLQDGHIDIQALPIKMSSLQQPAFIGRRQQHMTYSARTELLLPNTGQLSAGLVAFQNEHFHYYLGTQKTPEGYQVFIEQAKGDEPVVISSRNIQAEPGQAIVLGVEGDKDKISFSFQLAGSNTVELAENLDGKALSTSVAGGFVGTMLGLHSRQELAK